MTNISLERFSELYDSFQSKKIAVIGDIMLDRYFWGNVSRISPEAPVPVVDVVKENYHLGGAANVASNLRSLGIEAELCGLIGADNSGKTFEKLCGKKNIGTGGLYKDSNRPTTVKTRVFGNNQQIVRLDREVKESISGDGESAIYTFMTQIKDLSAIVIEDYNKGVLGRELIVKISEYGLKNDIPVFVDPKFNNFFEFKGAFLFKPNRKEAEVALGYQLNRKDDVVKAGWELMEKLQAQNVLITLGADGMMLFKNNGSIHSVATIARNIADVSGAGDTAIATLASAIAGGATIEEAAMLSNFAAGSVCEEPGIVSINYERLKTYIKLNSV
jgi:rfaE bifunctional protein kinase chain/domain